MLNINSKKTLITSDYHAPHIDWGLHNLSLDYIIDFKPDLIIINGDLADAPTISEHWTYKKFYDEGIQENIDVSFQILDDIRTVAPKAIIIFNRGNHEDRNLKLLAKNANEFVDLKQAGTDKSISLLSWYNMLNLEKLNIIANKNQVPYWMDRVLINNKHIVTHGSTAKSGAGNSVKGIVRKAGGLDYIMGHCHRLAKYYDVQFAEAITPDNRLTKNIDVGIGIEGGCMCDIKFSEAYMKESLLVDWHNGFTIIKDDEPEIIWYNNITGKLEEL